MLKRVLSKTPKFLPTPRRPRRLMVFMDRPAAERAGLRLGETEFPRFAGLEPAAGPRLEFGDQPIWLDVGLPSCLCLYSGVDSWSV
jgi:hypothetical protein